MIQFNLEQMVANTRTIDWEAVEAEVRPADISPDLWTVIWTHFKVRVGNTWADYQQALDDQAAYLAQYGSVTYDVRELFAAMLGRASGNPLRTTLAWSLDGYAPARGLPLAFARMAFDTLDQRFTIGPFGRSWSHSFEYVLTQPMTDTILMQGPGGAGRSFTRRPDGTWQAAAGDYGVLGPVAGGGYRLREKDGRLWQFDAGGRLASIAEPNGNAITLTYDATGKLARLSHSNGQSFTLEYNGQGRISRLTDHAGRVTQYFYDASGEHLLSAVAPGGITTAYAYTPIGGGAANHALATITYPDGTHQYYTHDAQGRLAAQWRDGDAERVGFSYDMLGTVFAQDAANTVTTLRLGARGQALEVQNPLEDRVSFQYDGSFNLTRLAQPDGGAARLTYDSLGNAVRMEDPLGHTTAMAYTTNLSRLDWLRDARGNLTDFSYDSSGNLTRITYPDSRSEAFGYDAAGNVTTVANRRGAAITFTYNALGQVTRKEYPDGRWVTYTYDAVGRLTGVTDISGAIVMQYDGRDFLTRIDYPSGHWFTFEYNAAGQRTRRAGDDGYTLNYTYDDAGRLQRLADGAGAEIVRYAYDAAGRLARETKGNGIATGYEYDAAGQLLHMVNHAPGGAVQSRFDYTYDANGNRTSMTTLAGTTAYEYDVLGQLVGVTYPDSRHVAYAYDPVGNRTVVSDNGVVTDYTTNNMNQYGQVGAATYTYDSDGNMTSKIDNTGTTVYEYDVENRLVRVSAPGSQTWDYSYDALGNRVAVTHNGVATRYVHDPVGLVDVAAEYDESGVLAARYVHGLGLTARIDAAGNPAYYAFDGTGHTRQVSDAAGGIVNSYDYDPFGIPLQTNETIPNPFRYVGRFGVMAEGNGLDFMRARLYSPDLGRFQTVDPIRSSGTLINLYAYSRNNPLSYVDPAGDSLLIVGAVIVTIGAATVGYFLVQAGSNYLKSESLNFDMVEAVAEGNMARVNQLQRESRRKEFWGWANTIFGTAAFDVLKLPRAKQDLFEPGWWMAMTMPFTRMAIRELPKPKLLQSVGTASLTVVRPVDPNEKVSPEGVGPQRAVSAGAELPYTIYFENVPTATAPAQEVFITDPLDPDLDWSTFQVTEIAFGDRVIAVTEGTGGAYARAVVPDYRPGEDRSWWVDVTAEIDYQTGRVVWAFRTLDPVTGELPEDPLAGFLPPNDGTGRGEGHVVFSVKPKAGAPARTRVANSASIVFDTNDPIETNEVWNTVGYQIFLPLTLRSR